MKKQIYCVIWFRPKITNIELKYHIIVGYKIETLFYQMFIISHKEGEINQSLSLIYCRVKIDGQIVRHIKLLRR